MLQLSRMPFLNRAKIFVDETLPPACGTSTDTNARFSDFELTATLDIQQFFGWLLLDGIVNEEVLVPSLPEEASQYPGDPLPSEAAAVDDNRCLQTGQYVRHFWHVALTKKP